jgi:long-subunit acyl-CoA synthetase (AMP-forming)
METANVASAAKPSAAKPSERALSVQNAVVMFNDRVKASAHKPALRWKEGGTWRSATWGDWDKQSREIAAGLIALGVGKGERSCVLANTRPEWLYVDIGILMAGGVTVPIYQSNLAHECEYIINDSGAKVVFVENPATSSATSSRSSTSIRAASSRSPTRKGARSSSSTTSSSPPTRRG